MNANGAPLKVGTHERFTYVDIVDGYHVGLIITTKDHSKFLEFSRDKMNAKLEARDLEDGKQLADFNFFAINQKTGKGIYQYYHQSCSIHGFGALCKLYYDNLKKQRIESAKEKVRAGGKELLPKDERKISKDYSGTLQYSVIVRAETFRSMVKELKRINSVTLTVSTLTYNDTVFTPIALVAKNMTQKFTFEKKSLIGNVVPTVLGVTGLDGVKRAKVEGVGEDGLDQVIKLYDTPDMFGEHDFDDIVGTMTISPADFAKSKFLRSIIDVANNETVIKDVGKT